ncbi:hypothetical protein [Nitrosomonas sp. Nm33]|nr:hypothetical protein [Nitrosomonas sp. Nm33]
MLILIMAKNIRALTVMLSLKPAKRTASARNSLKSIDPKPTARLNALSAL